MNEILRINDEQTVSARELHEKLKIKKRFSDWFETNSNGFVEGQDFTSVLTSTVVNNGARRELTDYQLTFDMAKHICLMSRTDEGKKMRQYLINLEKAWNTPELVMARALKVSQNLLERKDEIIKEQLVRIEEMRPKEIFADAVSSSESSILIRELAKLIKQNGVDIGEKRLWKWLRDNGYICKGSTEPTQKAMNRGLFERIVRTIDRGDGLPIEKNTTKVTGKGQVYFVNKFVSQ